MPAPMPRLKCRNCGCEHPPPTCATKPDPCYEALKELKRLQDQYRPDPAPHEWADAWEAADVAVAEHESRGRVVVTSKTAYLAALHRSVFLLQTQGNGPYDLEQARIVELLIRELS